jgi:hypothetical protein
MRSFKLLLAAAPILFVGHATAATDDFLPSYHYEAPIGVECMNRSMCVESLIPLNPN